MATYTRENLIATGYLGIWAGHVLRGALEGNAQLTFTDEEVEELVAAWMTTPQESGSADFRGFRSVVMPVGEEPLEGEVLVRQGDEWVSVDIGSLVPASSPGFRGPWAPTTAYKARELVIAPSSATAKLRGHLVSANADFTSGASFSATNWTLAEHDEAFTGAFAANTDYTAGQVVSYLGQLYSANANFTSAGAFLLSDWTPLSIQTASLVAVTPAGSLTQTDVQSALQGLAVRSDSVESDNLTGLPSKMPRAYFEINVRDYLSASERSGAVDATASLNALSLLASQEAVARGQRVRLWGFHGLSITLDGIRAREFVRWEMGDCEFAKIAGVQPMFYVAPIPTARVFTTMTLKGRTVVDSNTIHDVQIQRPTGVNVDRPGVMAVGGAITGPGIPAGATITAIDAANQQITISANATAATTVEFSHNPSFGTLASGTPTVSGVTRPLAWFEGRSVSGDGIPDGTTILDIDWTNPAAPVITLSNNATQSGAKNLTVTGTTYFGAGRGVELIGGVWDPNGFNTDAAPMNGAVLYLKYVEDYLISDAKVLHNWTVGDTWLGTWWGDILGYRGKIIRPDARGGFGIHQDGPHFTGGDDLLITHGYIEAGDDCFPFVNVPESFFAGNGTNPADPRPISNVVGRANIGRSAKGYLVRPATEPGAISGSGKFGPHFAVLNIDFEASGSAGRYRNGAIGIFDESQPDPLNRLLKNIRIRGTVEVGSAFHDGTNPYAVYLRGVNEADVEMHVNVIDGAVPIERYRARETDDCAIRLGGSGGTGIPLERRNRRLSVTERGRTARRRTIATSDEMFALPAAPWEWLKGTDATANVSVVTNVEGGMVKLTPGRANTGFAADGVVIQQTTLSWKLTTNGSMRMEARVKTTFLTGIVWFFGFVDQVALAASLTVPAQISGVTFTPFRNNFVGLAFDSLSTSKKVYGCGAKDAAGVSQDLGIDPVGGVNAPWMNLAVEVDADGTASFEVNGERVGTPLVNAVNIASLLTPTLRASLRNTGTGNWGELHVDYHDEAMVRAR